MSYMEAVSTVKPAQVTTYIKQPPVFSDRLKTFPWDLTLLWHIIKQPPLLPDKRALERIIKWHLMTQWNIFKSTDQNLQFHVS